MKPKQGFTKLIDQNGLSSELNKYFISKEDVLKIMDEVINHGNEREMQILNYIKSKISEVEK